VAQAVTLLADAQPQRAIVVDTVGDTFGQLGRGRAHRLAGEPMFVDIPADNSPAVAWANTHALTAQRPFTRMRRGHRVQDDFAKLWASSGPEKG